MISVFSVSIFHLKAFIFKPRISTFYRIETTMDLSTDYDGKRHVRINLAVGLQACNSIDGVHGSNTLLFLPSSPTQASASRAVRAFADLMRVLLVSFPRRRRGPARTGGGYRSLQCEVACDRIANLEKCVMTTPRRTFCTFRSIPVSTRADTTSPFPRSDAV
jgi:hypothetical protein